MKTYNYTIAEMISDAARVETETKKEIAQKYGIESNKSKEIEHAIYGMALDLVRMKSGNYDTDDCIAFGRYYNFPESAQKIRQSFDTMSIAFVAFYIDRFNKTRKSNAPYIVRTAAAYKKYMTARLTATDTTLEQIAETIKSQTANFHNIYVGNTLTASEKRFNYMLQFKDIKTMADAIKHCELPEEPKTTWRGMRETDEYLMWKKQYKQVEKFLTAIRQFRAYSHDFNLADYLTAERARIENEFDGCINLIAQRVKKTGMEQRSLKVEQILDTDAKAFDIYVSDNTKRMHARSIFCAEFSSLVTPHWRFIITAA